MLFSRSARVLALVAASGLLACTGSVEDAQPSTSINDTGSAPTTESGSADPEQPFDPSGEGEGEDPFFETDAGSPTTDSGAPETETETGPVDSGSEPKPTLGKLAEEAARELSVMKSSAYEHTTFVDEATGTFNYDCSGFVGYALNRVLPSQLSAVKTFSGVARPLAKHYETFFASITTTKSGWTRVMRAADLQPGDVVAWLKPADLVSTNTGHVMIVRLKPTLSTKRADEWIVPITDSSASFHGSTDTRSPSGEGLGSGPIGIIVDTKGAPIRYRWTGGVSTKEYTTAIAFARPG
jgi:hypothetical protein